ncbi:MAG: FAD/NAD(P)-binding protein [Planctomycetes bacterium]|nr:FAD/NAD(P)-binding protein [Planctomycetota bacterium]
MSPVWYRVHRVRRETHDVVTLELTPPEGAPPCSPEPGQFNMLYVFGTGEVPISISSLPSDRGELVHTVRGVGAVTNKLIALQRGDVVGVRGPFGRPWPVGELRGRDVVVVTGGIGLAPLRPVLQHLLAHRKTFGHVSLLYGARTPYDLLYRNELLAWRDSREIDVEWTVDRSSGVWNGNVGVVTRLISRATFDPERVTAFVCGPEIMIKYAIEALRNRGMATSNCYVSMERNMKCAVGFCGHCQYGPTFMCKDGPVFRFDHIEPLFQIREL